MTILAKFTKQPSEVKFFDIHYEDFLADLGTTIQGTPVVVSAPGITQPYPATALDGVVRVWAAGGTTGTSYLYTITVTCANNWVEEHEIVINVKDIPNTTQP